MLQVQHFFFEFVFQNTHKSKFISQRLSQNADATCNTDLSNTHYNNLLFGTVASSSATGGSQFFFFFFLIFYFFL